MLRNVFGHRFYSKFSNFASYTPGLGPLPKRFSRSNNQGHDQRDHISRRDEKERLRWSQATESILYHHEASSPNRHRVMWSVVTAQSSHKPHQTPSAFHAPASPKVFPSANTSTGPSPSEHRCYRTHYLLTVFRQPIRFTRMSTSITTTTVEYPEIELSC